MTEHGPYKIQVLRGAKSWMLWGWGISCESTSPRPPTVRVLRIGEHTLPTELIDHDYWLVDDVHPVRMHYRPTGEFLGASIEPDLLDTYRAAREHAWELAEPFPAWWERHPELHRDAYQKVS